MIKHNQTKNALAWDIAGIKFACEPWGTVDIPEHLVGLAHKMGLPLGNAPMAPERKAIAVSDAAKDAARNDEIQLLRGRIRELEAQAVVDSSQLEAEKAEAFKARESTAKLSKELSAAAERANLAERDCAAFKAQISDLMASIVELERKAPAVEQAAPKSQPPQPSPQSQKPQQKPFRR
jgi:chromosome segregation ATPase